MANIADHINIDRSKLQKVSEIRNAYTTGIITLQDAQMRLRTEIGRLEAHEIAWIEQELQTYDENECQNENIKALIALFSEILQETLNPAALSATHPLRHYYEENKLMSNLLRQVESLYDKCLACSKEYEFFPVSEWKKLYDALFEYRYHLRRKQNQLYAALEKKGFDRPSTTMWTFDDFIWNELKKAAEYLNSADYTSFLDLQSNIVADIRDLIDKEERILYPTAYRLLDNSDFEYMKSGDKEIGYAYLQTPVSTHTATKSDSLDARYLNQNEDNNTLANLHVAHGSLSLEQVNLIFRNLPVDISFVDEQEIVRFYNDSKHRIFPRSRNVIGRHVKNCHPPKSVHIVEEIVEKFRSGQENFVDFWINKEDTFIYISYTAVFDENGKFRGILEMMQDASHIRNLQGSRTLLTWEKETSTPKRESTGTDDCNKSELATLTADADDNSADGKTDEDVTGVTNINGDTKLSYLLEICPQLKNELVHVNPKFQILNSPLARIMIPKATISRMAERSGMPCATLLSAIHAILEKYKNF